ncbi:hypothetical protein PR202_gb03442 [Eleusine coracana subsp. coracana]|uniref:F-box domain-containing protein n=1 Tax=Eleusine coracana subsp. coracana TaxID=191504 RepID=A0AAV5DZG1_ELECO|nr:hypothetical protein PR202_gb03442 [Eleusine coracana subsp. coracana]
MEHQPCHGNRDMYAETAKPSSSLSASKVLGDDDLVGEILGRVDSPATLGRAALASKRWLHVASGRAFLRHFCKRHRPALLGFYVTGDGVPRPEFVPMPDTSTELAAALRRAAGSVFGSFPEFWSVVQDSRNGRVLFKSFLRCGSLALSDMMRHPGSAMAELLPPPPPTFPGRPLDAALLPDDDDDVLPHRHRRLPRRPDRLRRGHRPPSLRWVAPGPASAPRRPSSPRRR